MQKFSVLTWNLNSRTNKDTVSEQIKFISTYSPDIVTLQEVTINSLPQLTRNLHESGYRYVVNSFDLADDLSILKRKRKYGQIIASAIPLSADNPKKFDIPFIERVLSVSINISGNKIKLHTTHAPPGSSNGIIKINHFAGIYKFFEENLDDVSILTGDFNTPQLEDPKYGVVTWGQIVADNGNIKFARSKESDECSAEEWDDKERSIIVGLPSIGLKDVFRELYTYDIQDYSWILKRKGKIVSKRRYDHIFASTDFKYLSAEYLHDPIENKISDHSALLVVLEI